MNRASWIFFLCTASNLAFAQENALLVRQESIARLRSAIEYEVETKKLPAFSIALVDGDQIVWAQGFGLQNVQRQIPATADTVYRVGSVSKLFTDIATMQLVERDTLRLDAPITDALPEFRPNNPFETPITLRQLMSHRSGLVRESPVGHYFDPLEPTLAATVDSLNRTTLVYPPNTRTKYSNAGIAVVGYALELASGSSYADQIATKIFQPIGMKSSSFVRTSAIDERLAPSTMWTLDGRRFAAPQFKIGTAPAGNMYSSVNDLAQFIRCVHNGGRLGDGKQLVKEETLQLMMTPDDEIDGKPQGFGIGFHVTQLDGQRKIGHGGAVYGCATQLEILPDSKLGVAAVAALDCANGTVQRLVDYALRLLVAERAREKLPDYSRTGIVAPERARALEGCYHKDGSMVELKYLNGKLLLKKGVFLSELRQQTNGGGLIVDDVISYGPEVTATADGALLIGQIAYERVGDKPPKAPPVEWEGLIGEYGWDHDVLYILEDQGRLVALIEWFYAYPLTQLSENEFAFPNYGLYHGEKLKFQRDASGQAASVVAAEVLFQRRTVGTKSGETFKITPVRPVDELRQEAALAMPPIESGEFRQSDLVELVHLETEIALDIRYATINNFAGAVFYQQPRAFMQRPAAEAVVRVNKSLRPLGVGLLIHDAYRPWAVTKMFWDATPAEMKDFVANPANGSRHNRGCAVDLSLIDLKTGRPIEMVSGYDEFSPRAFPGYPGGTARQRWYRELLRRSMEREGFAVYDLEWWHFDYHDWKKYRIDNKSFEDFR